jgi:hypothetical protein
MRFKALLFASAFSSLLISLPALADIPPEDACTADQVGKACDTAVVGGQTDQPGTCRQETCTRPTKDGAIKYDCFRCEADKTESGGAGGQPSETAGNGGQPSESAGIGGQPTESAGTGGSVTQTAGKSSGGSPNTTPQPTAGSAASNASNSGGGGCSISAPRAGGSALLGLAMAWGVALGLRRRSRS